MPNSDYDKIFAEAAEKIRQEAFAAGWKAAVTAIVKAAETEAPAYLSAQTIDYNDSSSKASNLPLPGTLPSLAYQVIKKQPGMTGAEVVTGVLNTGVKTTEAAIRVALARIAKRRLVTSRHRKWFPL
jgi:hypothetical protein